MIAFALTYTVGLQEECDARNSDRDQALWKRQAHVHRHEGRVYTQQGINRCQRSSLSRKIGQAGKIDGFFSSSAEVERHTSLKARLAGPDVPLFWNSLDGPLVDQTSPMGRS